MTFPNVLQSMTRKLEKAVAVHAARGLPISAGERCDTSRLHLRFSAAAKNGASIVLVRRNPHATEGTRDISREIDMFMWNDQEVDALIEQMMQDAVTLLEEDAVIATAGEDPLAPPAHRYRCHSILPAIAQFNGWSLDDLVRPGTIDAHDGQHIVHSDEGIHTSTLVNGHEPHVVRLSRMLVRRRVHVSYLTLKAKSKESPVGIQLEESGGNLLMTISDTELADTLLNGAMGRPISEIVTYPTFGPIANMIIQRAEQGEIFGRPHVTLLLGMHEIQLQGECP